jgi:hypothetical protein
LSRANSDPSIVRSAYAAWPLLVAAESSRRVTTISSTRACARATRTGALIGAVAGTAVLGGFYYLAGVAADALRTPGQWAGNSLAVSLGASLILMVLVTALGPPTRAEEDEPRRRRAARDD